MRFRHTHRGRCPVKRQAECSDTTTNQGALGASRDYQEPGESDHEVDALVLTTSKAPNLPTLHLQNFLMLKAPS